MSWLVNALLIAFIVLKYSLMESLKLDELIKAIIKTGNSVGLFRT